jgi:two-component system KDP operon response regulator KdpE
MNRKKILIVDDDAIILRTLTTKLSAHGYEILTASDGSASVSIARQAKPDLIVLDINLPVDLSMDWDAFKIMEWLKRMEGSAKIPVIIISGGDAKKASQLSQAAGALAFFHKPINHDELIALLRKTLGEQSVRPVVVGV